MKSCATLILNRNLPEVTDRLVENLIEHNDDVTDVYVIESGSHEKGRSSHASFIADWPEAREHGLRFARGFNFGLSELAKMRSYDYVFLLCQDVILPQAPVISVLIEELERYPRLGIVSPLSPEWGESSIIPDNDLRMFWFVNMIGWMIRGSLIDLVKNTDDPQYMSYLFDGTNFRGYDTDIELVAKAYANDFAAGITSRVRFQEDKDMTDRLASRMMTEPQRVNRPLMYDEGAKWLKKKYGFNSRWNMVAYAKAFYNQFFENHPDYRHFRV